MSPTPELIALAHDAASKHALDPALVCAVVEQESAWDTHAIRYEPAFRTRYVAPLGLPSTEEIARSISWGLMQVMGQVAREHGFSGKFLSALCDPAAGLDIGCAVLASKLASASRDGSAHVECGLSRAESRGGLPADKAGLPPLSSAGAGSGASSGEARRAADSWQEVADSPESSCTAGGSPANLPADGMSENRRPAAGATNTAAHIAQSPAIGSCVEAQGFSPAKSDGPTVPALLPQALAQAGPPGRRRVEPGESDAGPKREKAVGQGITLDENLIARALQLWNGGANPDYAAQVLARLPRYL